MFDNTEDTSKNLAPWHNSAEICVSADPWLGLAGPNWRPITYDETVERQYYHCLELLNNPHIKSKRQKEIMAEIAYVMLQAEGTLGVKDFGDFGVQQDELLTQGLFYVGSAYDKEYRIVPFGSGRLHIPPLLVTDQSGDFFPVSRMSHTFTFQRSKALEAIRDQVLNGTIACTALTAAIRRMRTRGDLS